MFQCQAFACCCLFSHTYFTRNLACISLHYGYLIPEPFSYQSRLEHSSQPGKQVLILESLLRISIILHCHQTKMKVLSSPSNPSHMTSTESPHKIDDNLWGKIYFVKYAVIISQRHHNIHYSNVFWRNSLKLQIW